MNPPMEQTRAGAPDTRHARRSAGQVFDPRALPERRGAGRAIVIALGVLAVIGAGGGAGCVLWRNELAPHELVRRPPPIPGPRLNLATVPGASAAPRIAEESTAAAVRSEGDETSPSREAEAAAATRSGDAGIEPGGLATAEAAPAARVAYAGSATSVREGPGTESSGPGPGGPSGIAGADGGAAPGGVDASRTPPGGARAESLPASASASGEEDRGGRPDPRGHDAGDPPLRPPAARPVPPADEQNARADGGVDAGGEGPIVDPVEQAGAALSPDPGGGDRIEIRRRRRADHVADTLERAYAALGAGNSGSASEAYRAVLGDEPRNRDALLGLAAVAAREGRWDEAAGHYSRVLASHPADTIAEAALIAIDERDPTRGESRLETLLWSEPRAAYLHFALGNVYAAQSRWPEAQASYFNAYRFDSGNADYAYNLAVSLDHLARPESALDFYREALALARSRPAGFEAATVLARIREMDASAETGAAPASRTPEPADATPAGSDQ